MFHQILIDHFLSALSCHHYFAIWLQCLRKANCHQHQKHKAGGCGCERRLDVSVCGRVGRHRSARVSLRAWRFAKQQKSISQTFLTPAIMPLLGQIAHAIDDIVCCACCLCNAKSSAHTHTPIHSRAQREEVCSETLAPISHNETCCIIQLNWFLIGFMRTFA